MVDSKRTTVDDTFPFPVVIRLRVISTRTAVEAGPEAQTKIPSR